MAAWRYIPLLFVLLSMPLRAQWKSVADLDSLRYENDATVILHGGLTVTRVQFLADDIVQVRFRPGTLTLPPDNSWSVVKTDWPPPSISRTKNDSAIVLASPEIQVVITLRPLRIAFLDRAGRIINSDHPGKGMSSSGSEVRVWKVKPGGEWYYGLGEKSGSFERSGSHFTMWNSDIPAYSADTDPLYQSIPFFLGIRDGTAYGIFFDNPSWSSFDLGKESRDQISFGAETGEINYYFFYGPSPRKIIGRYSQLVGRMPLPPRWSLGYQQSRWSYAPESRVRAIAHAFRSLRIPCDVLYFDIDYMEGYRVFSWSSKNFPAPERLMDDLAREGFKVVVIIDPGIKVDTAYATYRSGLAGDHFLRRPDGSLFTGDVWPGRCVFPDFSNAGTRAWWGQQFEGLVRAGVKGWWTDMNEPSVFNTSNHTLDLNVLHQTDFGLQTHASNHNTYGMLMTRATGEGIQRLTPGQRTFVLTRASYAGGQRFAATWTGDNVASWEHLGMALSMCLGLSVSGQPFVGSDIGGFFGSPSGELFARWLQLGVFTPLMRAHSENTAPEKEPWTYGAEFTAINRETINLRYVLLPYIYGTMVEAASTGIPPMRPMVLEDPHDPRNKEEASQFLFGSDILVAPVLKEGARKREVALPAGTWYDYWTNNLYHGGKTITIDAPLNRVPFFVRGGAAIPTQQVVQYTNEAAVTPLTFLLYPGPAGSTSASAYYEDDGTTLRYTNGEFLTRTLLQTRYLDSLAFTLSAVEGSYRAPDRTLEFRIPATGKSPKRIILNGTPLSRRKSADFRRTDGAWEIERKTGTIVIRCPDTRTTLHLDIHY